MAIIFSLKKFNIFINKFLLIKNGIQWNKIIELIINILFEKLKFNPIGLFSSKPGVPAVKKLISK